MESVAATFDSFRAKAVELCTAPELSIPTNSFTPINMYAHPGHGTIHVEAPDCMCDISNDKDAGWHNPPSITMPALVLNIFMFLILTSD